MRMLVRHTKHTMSESIVKEVFGNAGEVFQPLVDSITSEIIGSKYLFLDIEKFEQLPPEEMNRVYWTELLYRAHWAASSNLLRHKRWVNACLALYHPTPNYLGFCAALRGLVEAAADASHSLGGVPLTLAGNYRSIQNALTRKADALIVLQDLEDMLIHFHFARKLHKSEQAPDPHKAKSANAYISSIEPPDKPLVKPLYAQLCQVVHPAAQSLLWMSPAVTEDVELLPGDDKTWITELCGAHQEAIEWAQMQSVNTSIFILQVLNLFPIDQLKTKSVEKVNTSSMPLWHKIDRALKSQW